MSEGQPIETVPKEMAETGKTALDAPKFFEWGMQLPSGGKLKVEVVARMTEKDLKLIKLVIPMIMEVLEESSESAEKA